MNRYPMCPRCLTHIWGRYGYTQGRPTHFVCMTPEERAA